MGMIEAGRVDIRGFASGLDLSDEGIWVSNLVEAVSYPSQGNEEYRQIEDESFWFRHRNECILEVVRRFPPEGFILDVGGGNGFVASGLERADYSTVLLEPGRVGARNAKARGLRHVVCATLEGASLRPQTIPAVGLFDVLEHIAEDVAFLKTLRTALLPEGRLYLSVPAFEWLWSVEDEKAGHFRRYTLNRLHKTLHQAGFDILYSTYLFHYLPLPILLLRSLPSKLGLRRGEVKAGREHAPPAGFGSRVLAHLNRIERARIREGHRIPIGTSCLMVGTRRGAEPHE